MRPSELLGKSTPVFELPDQDGKIHKLSEEACSFKDNLSQLQAI